MSSLSIHPKTNVAPKEEADARRPSQNAWHGSRGSQGQGGSRGQKGGYNNNFGEFNSSGGNHPYCHLCE